MLKDFSGLCTITIRVLHRGAGSTITILPRGYPVGVPRTATMRADGQQDLRGIANIQAEFTLGKPFRPFEQLMGVLPEASKEHIPVAYRVCLQLLEVQFLMPSISRI